MAALAPLGCRLQAQAPGSYDSGFVTSDGVNNTVSDFKPQNNGKTFVTGFFTGFGNKPRNYLALLNADGSLDSTFNPDPAVVNGVALYTSVLAVQADGKPLVSIFNNGYAFVRLNLDGTQDTAFSRSVSNRVYGAASLSGGQILIGGAFSSLNGLTPNYLARLGANGSPDSTFDSVGVGPNGPVYALAVQADGKILIGGAFTTYNGITRNRVARLKSDGSLDPDFDPGIGPDNAVTSVILQPDGRYILIGNFGNVAGTARHGVARLSANGLLDSSYANGLTGTPIVKAALQPDGELVCAAYYVDVTHSIYASNGEALRLDTNGNRDATFVLSSSVPSDPSVKPSVYGVAVQTDGKILLGGVFSVLNGAARTNLARLNPGLTPDTSFYAGSGINSSVAVTAAPGDGRVYVGGYFTTVRGGVRSRVARLNGDGSLDATFDPGTGANGAVKSLTVQPDGKLLLGGDFTTVNGVNRSRIARLNQDGSLDGTFGNGTGMDSTVTTMLLQPDGQLVVGGDFTTVNGTARNRVARLNPDGSVDTAFDPDSGADTTVQTLAIQLDHKLLVGGSFAFFNGARHPCLVRLNTNGSLDAGFLGSAYPGGVTGLVVLTDGKIAIAGNFTSVDGVDNIGLARLNTDGSLDSTFSFQRSTTSDAYHTLLAQTNGRLLVGGGFDRFDNITSTSDLVRINADGTDDGSFNAGTKLSNLAVYGLTPQVGGKIVVAYGYVTQGVSQWVAQFYAGDGSNLLPAATTGTATADASGGGTILSAVVNPNGSGNYYFQYGTTSAYGMNTATSSLPAGTGSVTVSTSVSNLTAGTTYHYRVVAYNSVGLAEGTDATFIAGTPSQSWRQAYFGTMDNTGNAADSADPDGDGISNLMERALGLNPTVANVGGLPKATVDSGTGRLVITATRGANTADLNFSAEASADMVNWTTSGVTILTNTSTTFQARDDGPSGPRRFLRLRVTQP